MRSKLMHGVLVASILVVLPMGLAAQERLDPQTHPKFVNPLPIPARIDATAGGRFDVSIEETIQWLGLVDPSGARLHTRVWGYGMAAGGRTGRGGVGKLARNATYPGPTFVAMRDVPLDVKWLNNLPGRHLLPVDPTVHWANPAQGGIATVTHLHGGHTESASDGLPESWYTKGFRETGPTFVKQTLTYHNDQESATLWYHDHALGITRLNVYAGLAGFYLLRDANELQLAADGVLPTGPYEVEIAIQDRMFSATGELFYPADSDELPPEAPRPSVLPEFFGDFILVNGAAWPIFDVEPRKYRLRYLNGSDSRFYVLEFRDAMDAPRAFLQIGTDGGFLEQPVALTQLVLGPGERADLVVDFAGLMGGEILLRNLGPDGPFGGLPVDPAEVADAGTTGQIMKFRVSKPLAPQPDASVDARTSLRAERIPRLAPTGATRQLILIEGEDEYGRLHPMLGTVADGMMHYMEPVTENPMLDDVEVWEIYNTTEDAHPIHLHLVQFQILDRQSFTADQDPMTGALSNIRTVGPRRRPLDNEDGFKDTAQMFPGEVTRVIARFDLEGLYVWHCHILSHEDHTMMRPYYVGPMPGMTATAPLALSNAPNPFNPSTRIRFALPAAGRVELRIFDVAGRLVRDLASGTFAPGEHEVVWDGKNTAGRRSPSGVYFYRLTAGDAVLVKRMVMLK
jgi:spore coat protein A